jgi:hypothetical protein
VQNNNNDVQHLKTNNMKNYDRFVLNSMRPTIVNDDRTGVAGFLNRICAAIVKMFNRSG